MKRGRTKSTGPKIWSPPSGFLVLDHPDLMFDRRNIEGVEWIGVQRESAGARQARVSRNLSLYDQARIKHNIRVRKLRSPEHDGPAVKLKKTDLKDAQNTLFTPAFPLKSVPLIIATGPEDDIGEHVWCILLSKQRNLTYFQVSCMRCANSALDCVTTEGATDCTTCINAQEPCHFLLDMSNIHSVAPLEVSQVVDGSRTAYYILLSAGRIEERSRMMRAQNSILAQLVQGVEEGTSSIVSTITACAEALRASNNASLSSPAPPWATYNAPANISEFSDQRPSGVHMFNMYM
jgi:hypothetical protein